MAITKKQIKDFDALLAEDFAPDDLFLVQTGISGVTHNITKEEAFSHVLSVSGGDLFGDLTIDGNLIVNGTTTTIESTDLQIEDNKITLNKGQTTPLLDSGLVIERGTSTDAELVWNEANDRWEAGLVGNTKKLITEDDIDITNVSQVGLSSAVEVLDTFNKYNSIGTKWVIVANDGTNFRISEILATWDVIGDNITFTETGATDIGDTSDLLFAVDIDSNDVRLLVSINSGSWNFRIQRNVI